MADGKKMRKVVGNAEEIPQYTLPGYSFSSAWSSPEAFANYIEKQKRSKAWCDAGWGHDEGWSGTKDMETAIKMAREGWKEGADQVERLRRLIEANNPTSPRLIRYGIAGTTPNVPRAIAGIPVNMRVPDLTKSRKKPVITLVSNMSANWTVGAKHISNRAAAVAAIIDKIESSGYSCEVLSTATTRGGSWWAGGSKDYTAATTVCLKRSDQPVDIVRLSYGLGHASMFRRLVFADWGVEPTAQNGLGEGLGCNCEIFLPESDEFDNKAIYTIPSAEGISKLFETEELSMTEGMNHLLRELKKQGCPAFAKVDIPEPAPDDKVRKRIKKKG